MDETGTRRGPPKRPAEEDTAAMLAWFGEQEKYLEREGKFDKAAEAALMAELDAFGARTLAANAESQRIAIERIKAAGAASQSAPAANRSGRLGPLPAWLIVLILLAFVSWVAYRLVQRNAKHGARKIGSAPRHSSSPMSSSMTRESFSVLVFAVLCTGCATSPELTKTPAQLGLTSSCCANANAIPRAGTLRPFQEVALSPTTAHFDFGMGLAPAIAFSLPADATGQIVELRAENPSKSVFRPPLIFPVALAVFLDGEGNRISSPVNAAFGKRYESDLVYPLRITRLAGVPPGATTVLITVDPRLAGQKARASSEIAATTMPVAGAYINFRGGVSEFEYDNAVYGSIEVLLHPNGVEVR